MNRLIGCYWLVVWDDGGLSSGQDLTPSKFQTFVLFISHDVNDFYCGIHHLKDL